MLTIHLHTSVDSHLPVEMWMLVVQQCRAPSVRQLCSSAAAVPPGLVTREIVCYLINAACRDGQLPLLQWLLDQYQVQFSAELYGQFPAAFAIENGHTHILSFLFPKYMHHGCLHGMVRSVPLALTLEHWDTVAWILEALQEEGYTSLGDYSKISFTALWRCIETKSTDHLKPRDQVCHKNKLNQINRHDTFFIKGKFA